MAKADLTDLNLQQKQLISRTLSADMRGKELADFGADKNEARLERSIERKLKAFEKEAILERREKGEEAPKSSKERFINASQKAVTDLSAQEVMFAEALLATSGYSNIILDGNLTAEEDAYRKELGGKLATGGTVLGLRGTFQAEAAATAEAAEVQAKTVEEQQTLTNTGLKVLGYKDLSALTDTFTADNQDWLQKNSRTVFGHDMNIHEIDHFIKDHPEMGLKAVGYAVSQGDYREQVGELLEKGDITKAQTILKLSGHDVEVTGNYNAATAQSAKDYIETPKGLSETINYGLSGNIGSYSLEVNIKNGAIPMPVADNIPDTMPELKLLAEDMEGLPLEEQQEMLQEHLIIPENFAAYDQYLETKYTADLTAQYSAKFSADAERLAEQELRAATPIQNIPSNATPTQLVAADRHMPDYLKEMDKDAATLYNKISHNPNLQDRDARQELGRIGQIARRIDGGVKTLEDGTATGSPAALKGDIVKNIHRFEDEFGKLTSDQEKHLNDYIDSKDAGNPAQPSTPENQPPVGTQSPNEITQNETGVGEWIGNKLSSFFKEANASESANDVTNAPTPKVSGSDLDLGPAP